MAVFRFETDLSSIDAALGTQEVVVVAPSFEDACEVVAQLLQVVDPAVYGGQSVN